VRIAWFTPLSSRSAIGEFSCHVTAALSAFAEIEIWTSDQPPYHPTALPVIGYSHESDDLKLLPSRDAIVYNMGDYLPFHANMHVVAQRNPGVVILHDRVLHHLYAGMWLQAAEPERELYVERMRAYYGEDGAEAARSSLEGERRPVWESDAETLRYPLFEEGIRGAIGVVTHSESQAADVRARWLGPVRALHLPCYSEILARIEDTPAPARAAASQEPVRLLTVGHVNPNKQVRRVVEMLAADPELAARVQYTVVGPDDGFQGYVEDLRRLIARHAGSLHVEVLGWRPDAELDRLMAQADVFVNLRHPVMEGGSASLMRQLAYGRPILCFQSGFFAELPAQALARVPPGDFAAAAQTLRGLVASVEQRRALGARARALATSYDERSYAEGLLELIGEARRAAPALGFLDNVARELGQMGVDTRLPIFEQIATDFARILDV
jgi:glycosyltransferase involved in cell wall biosynthesis